MTLFFYELRKTFGKTTLILMFCLLILNGVLIISHEKKRGYGFNGSDYRNLYSLEEMQENKDGQLEYLKTSMEKEGITSGYFLWRYVKTDIEKTLGYDEYLRSIASSAEKYGMLSVFMDDDEFAKRNIEKTAGIYATLPYIVVVPGRSRGIVMASQYRGSVILGFVFILHIVFMLVTREKEIGTVNLTMTTRFGHVHHGVVKLGMCLISSVAISLVLEAENWMIAAVYYGLGDMSRSIQSIPEYQPCIFEISISVFLVIMVLFRTICIFMVSVVVFFIACRSNGTAGMALRLVAVLGMEGMMYFTISGKSVWGFLKYINIYASLNSQELLGNYMNLNFFGYPVWYLPVFIGFVSTLIVLFGGLSIWAYAGMQSSPSSRRLGWYKLKPRTSSVFLQECYRYFISERILLILLAFVVIRLITFSPVKESFAFQEDIYYKLYMLKLEGMYTDEKENEIDKEEQLYSEITEKAKAAAAATEDSGIRGIIWEKYNDETAHIKVLDKVRTQASYLKDKQGAFLYDKGYCILAGEDSGKKQNMLIWLAVGLLMVICSVFMYGPDYQAGTDRMIRTAKKGRGYLFVRREMIGTLVLAAVFGIAYIPYIISVLNAYGTQGMDFPVCSIRYLEWCPHWITVRMYLILQNIIRFIVLWTEMNLLWYISTKTRSMSYTVGTGMVLCLGGVLLIA